MRKIKQKEKLDKDFAMYFALRYAMSWVGEAEREDTDYFNTLDEELPFKFSKENKKAFTKASRIIDNLLFKKQIRLIKSNPELFEYHKSYLENAMKEWDKIEKLNKELDTKK